MYPIELTRPMEEELTSKGIIALKDPSAVEEALNKSGTTLILVNSVCGCAAGNARPGVLNFLKNNKVDNAYTVFAGVDTEAVKGAREYLQPFPPSSPSIALLKNKKIILMLERKNIEGLPAEEISQKLKNAFERIN